MVKKIPNSRIYNHTLANQGSRAKREVLNSRLYDYSLANQGSRAKREVLIEISTKHIHLSQKDLEALFGKGYKLKKLKNLSQPDEFAAEEKIDVEENKRKIFGVRIIGPVRGKTQVELSHTDLIFLRIKPVVRESGDIKDTPGALLIGPKGKVRIKEGVINAWRHIHCSCKEAKELGLKNGMVVSVETKGICSVTFHNVKVHVNPDYQLCTHLDTDEGNAACIIDKGEGYLVI